MVETLAEVSLTALMTPQHTTDDSLLEASTLFEDVNNLMIPHKAVLAYIFFLSYSHMLDVRGCLKCVCVCLIFPVQIIHESVLFE